MEMRERGTRRIRVLKSGGTASKAVGFEYYLADPYMEMKRLGIQMFQRHGSPPRLEATSVSDLPNARSAERLP